MEITQNSASAAQTGAAAESSKKLVENFDTFLSLLTTQLKYQDPLDPMDSGEFVAQLVQFTNVEQAIATNSNLEKLLNVQSSNQMVGALGYIGKQVEAKSSEIALKNGQATFSYTLNENAASAAIIVTDKGGNTVYTTPAETTAGKHSFTWQGTDGKGASVADGTYTIRVAARDDKTGAVGTSTALVGTVDGVETTEDGFVLSIGGVKVNLSDLITVSNTGSGA